MSLPKLIEKDYYLNLEKEQLEILKIQKSNLQFLQEDYLRIEKEINQSQMILDEIEEVNFILRKTIDNF